MKKARYMFLAIILMIFCGGEIKAVDQNTSTVVDPNASLAAREGILVASATTPEYKMLEVVSIEKQAYKNIGVPKVIADKKTARRIFERLNLQNDEIDFSKNVVCITTLDINDPDPKDCHLKPHYSKDGKYLYIQHLCRLRPRNKSDKLWVEPDKLWVQVVKISKGGTIGFQEYNYATKKRDTVLQW